MISVSQGQALLPGGDVVTYPVPRHNGNNPDTTLGIFLEDSNSLTGPRITFAG